MMMEACRDLGLDVSVATTDDNGPGLRFGPSTVPAPFDGLANNLPAEHGQGRSRGDARSTLQVFPKQSEFYKVSLPLWRWLHHHVNEFDLLHIHAMFSFSTIAASRAARRAGVPYVIRPLGTLNRYGMTQRRQWLKQRSLAWFDGPALEAAAVVHFTAQAEYDEARELNIRFPRTAILPLAVEPEAQLDRAAFDATFPELRGEPFVLFLSRIDPKKNIESLLHAMASGLPAHPALRLMIAGDGSADYVSSLKQLATQLQLSDRITWAGFLGGSLKATALHAASLFVLPSHSENFGIAAAEALLAGLPSVLGKGIAIADEVQAAGAGIATAPDPASVAAAMACFLDDPARAAACGAAARAFAQREYSKAAMGQRLHDLYRSILGPAHA